MTLPKPMDHARLQAGAAEACAMLKVLSNRDRLLLLCQMTQGEFSVSELEEICAIHQPTLSQQLSVLRAEHLVSTRREGKQVFYTIASPAALALLQVLFQLYCPKDEGGCHAD